MREIKEEKRLKEKYLGRYQSYFLKKDLSFYLKVILILHKGYYFFINSILV